jgi:hypothetical protein
MVGSRGSFQQLRSDFINCKRALSLAQALPRFFRDRLTLQRAEDEIKELLETRVERFLTLAYAQIYQSPASPYLRLLRHAGCDYSDLQSEVRRLGLENTLAKLAGEGVYLTSDEFKGKTEVVRGTESFRVSPLDFERRDASAGFMIQSSGTRNAPIDTFSPLEWRSLQALAVAVFYSAHDLVSCSHAVYEPVIAGRMTFVVINGRLGIPTSRWFALRVAVHGMAEERYHHLNARMVAMIGRWCGVAIANPEYLAMENVRPIIDWVNENKRKGTHCCITTVVSNAARIARAALEIGLSLNGVSFHISGEPLTKSKKQLIEGAGARIALHYGPGGGNGSILGCAAPRFVDEMHVPQTSLALVAHPNPFDWSGPAIYPLMVTTLHRSAPRFLFNVENGDYATLTTRDCGCALERVGFTQHVHTVRSFEKFTSEGMNYFGTDMFELLESVIPSEFGGGPGHYQLVEEEDDNGQTRLTLLVHPDVGDLDSEKLLLRLHRGLAEGSRNNRFMSGIWQDAGTLRIRREAPHTSARGKTLPLHIATKRAISP